MVRQLIRKKVWVVRKNDIQLIDAGLGHIISLHKVISILVPEKKPLDNIVSVADAQGMLIPVNGRFKVKSIIVMSSGHVILSSLLPQTLMDKVKGYEKPIGRGKIQPKTTAAD